MRSKNTNIKVTLFIRVFSSLASPLLTLYFNPSLSGTGGVGLLALGDASSPVVLYPQTSFLLPSPHELNFSRKYLSAGPQWAAGESLFQWLVHFLFSPWCSLCSFSFSFVLSTCLHLAFFCPFLCFPQEAIILAEWLSSVLQWVGLSWAEPAGQSQPL